MHFVTDFLSRLLSPEAGESAIGVSHLLAAVALAYLGGVLSSLTPCVYPMIPITVSVVGGIGPSRRSWQEVWLRGGAYVGGMAVTYSFLGVLAGITGRVFGSFTNTGGWYLALGLIMTLAALVMLDIIPFEPLVWWEITKRKLGFHSHRPTQNQERETTLFGAFGLGASSGLIAAPCTTPVLTSILAYIAKTQSIGVGLALMLAFSLGLGTLLLLIAVFAGMVRVLPKSGSWMKTVKVVSGLVLLGFAEYLFYQAGSIGLGGGR